MTNEECFDAWAPEGAVWSLWAKPVLFAQRVAVTPPGSPSSLPDASGHLWLSQGGTRTAVVVDLPGVESVTTGLALARRGCRPVPLYNTSDGPSPLVNVAPIVEALASAALALRGITLQPDAPPAFLVDAGRARPTVPSNPGSYDNRWVVFPQDFPSGTFLRSRGIAEVIVLHDRSGIQEDLAHVLLRWQETGIRMLAVAPGDTSPREFTVKKPSWFRRVWYRAIALAGLRRNNAGGFGGVIPTAGGGGYG
jgi:hypothetical protein